MKKKYCFWKIENSENSKKCCWCLAAFCEAQRNRAERSSPVADLSDHKFTTCGQTIFMQLGHNTERSLTFWRNIRNIQVRNLGSTPHYRVNCCLRQFGQFRFGKTIAHYYHWRPEKRKIFQNVSPKWSIILVCDDCTRFWMSRVLQTLWNHSQTIRNEILHRHATAIYDLAPFSYENR